MYKKKMLMKSFSSIIILSFSILMIYSCQGTQKKQWEKNYEQKISQIGKNFIISQKLTDEQHYLIYHNYDSIYYDDLESNKVALFSNPEKYLVKGFDATFSEDGNLAIKETEYDWKKPDFSFVKKLRSENPFEVYGDLILIIQEKGKPNYWFSIQSPNILVEDYNLEKGSALLFETLGYAYITVYGFESSIPGIDNYKFQDRGLMLDVMTGGSRFSVELEMNQTGNVGNICTSYISSPILNKFPISELGTSSVGKAVAKYEEQWLKEKEARLEEENKQALEEFRKQCITLGQLSSAFRNEIKAKRDYINKKIYLECKIEKIDYANGWFDEENYKYKVQAFALEAFDEWISDYDLTGYTNDENFVNLDLPSSIIMECILISGSRKSFKFKDCKLIAY